ncbi:MAG TPA: TetR/AcrR family transcriptional regulator [Crocinitomix sp.]|nr:TetR/AcrR family transcriptional regulator [Crocinitomix sp.]
MELSKRQLQIIDAAGKLLSEGGIQNLTIKKLAFEMGFSEAALYRHFKSKDEIIYAMLTYLAQDMDERISTLINNNDSATEKIYTLFENQFKFFKKHKHYLSVVFSDGLWEQSENIHIAVKKIMSTKHKHLKLIIEEGIKNKELTAKLSSESLIHILMGTFRLHVLKWRISGYKFDLVTSGNQLVQDYVKLIKV